MLKQTNKQTKDVGKASLGSIQPGDFTSLISQHFSSTSSNYNLQFNSMHRDFTLYFKLLKKIKIKNLHFFLYILN
jgi:hypothetical protein